MVNRVLLGKMFNTYGMRVTLPTGEVTNDAINPGLVSFDTRWVNTGKIWMAGRTTNMSTNSGLLSAMGATISLGYTPASNRPPWVYMLGQRNSTNTSNLSVNDVQASIPADYYFVDGSTVMGVWLGRNHQLFSYVSYIVARPFE